MHFIANLFMIFSVWRWGNWRNWKGYHATMVFLPFANMLHHFLTADYQLWALIPDVLISLKIVEILYTFIILPGTVLIFLSRYPAASVKDQFIYNLKWITAYSAIEWIFYITGRIVYKNSWTLGWTVVFYCIMFPSLYLHYKRPLLSYLVFIIVVTAGILYFNIPILTPQNG